jgi:hypothetical protein
MLNDEAFMSFRFVFFHHAMTSSVDTLTSKDVKELLSDKYILILGDSGKQFVIFLIDRKH